MSMSIDSSRYDQLVSAIDDGGCFVREILGESSYFTVLNQDVWSEAEIWVHNFCVFEEEGAEVGEERFF